MEVRLSPAKTRSLILRFLQYTIKLLAQKKPVVSVGADSMGQ